MFQKLSGPSVLCKVRYSGPFSTIIPPATGVTVAAIMLPGSRFS